MMQVSPDHNDCGDQPERVRAGYSATVAQARADALRLRPKVPKPVADRVLVAQVEARL